MTVFITNLLVIIRCYFYSAVVLSQAIDIRHFYDKFPSKGGLKDLYERGPQTAFFLVKFWVSNLSINLAVIRLVSVT
jgi:YAP binding domain